MNIKTKFVPHVFQHAQLVSRQFLILQAKPGRSTVSSWSYLCAVYTINPPAGCWTARSLALLKKLSLPLGDKMVSRSAPRSEKLLQIDFSRLLELLSVLSPVLSIHILQRNCSDTLQKRSVTKHFISQELVILVRLIRAHLFVPVAVLPGDAMIVSRLLIFCSVTLNKVMIYVLKNVHEA